MKAEFELTINEITGEPSIKFRHHDKNNSIEQRLLKIFVTKAKEKGLKIVNISGHIEVGTLNSWENYEIKVND